MTIDLVADLWSELRRYISPVDINEAADTVVNVLIDNDHDAEDIRSAFKGDNNIKRALQSYIDDTEEDYDDVVDDEEY